jgi:hypothetical protein
MNNMIKGVRLMGISRYIKILAAVVFIFCSVSLIGGCGGKEKDKEASNTDGAKLKAYHMKYFLDNRGQDPTKDRVLKEIQKSQIICIQMPESIFATSVEKDFTTLYFWCKVFLSLQLRKFDIEREKHVKVNIIIDEVYQVQKTLEFIASKLSQLPKFTCKCIFTCHYLNQIGILRNELRASNASYMLLQGSNVSNFDELKQEFNNLNYTVDDLLNLQRYHSLNLLSYEGGYYAGITKLPPPIK